MGGGGWNMAAVRINQSQSINGDDRWSVITPGDNDLERSKAAKDHHCVEAASHCCNQGGGTHEIPLKRRTRPSNKTNQTSVTWHCCPCGGKEKQPSVQKGPSSRSLVIKS